MKYQELQRVVSQPRLEVYLGAANGDKRRAVRLYEWNVMTAGAALSALAMVEVVLRNVTHVRIHDFHSSLHVDSAFRWYDEPNWFRGNSKGFTPRQLEQMTKAKFKAKDPGVGRAARPPEGRIVAELTLGFWRNLYTRAYEHTLWYPALRAGFPFLTARGPAGLEAVSDRFDGIHRIRNRVAHHEPLLNPIQRGGSQRPFSIQDFATSSEELLSWIDPKLASWFAKNEKLTSAISRRP
jgi:hypothetical protein